MGMTEVNSPTALPSTDWQGIFDQRLVSAEEAVSHVRSGDRIWLPLGQRVSVLISGLLGRANELRDVEIQTLPDDDYGWFDSSFQGHININVLYAWSACRDAVNDG